jgi:recombination protein RecA
MDPVGSLTEVQHSIIIGSLLGDGAMRCKANALLEINHCFGQRAYVDWKYGHLIDLVRTGPKARAGNGSRIAYRFTTMSLTELTPYHAAFYRGGKKAIPALELTPLALAVWFMDDGSKSYRTVYLNTQQFDVPSQERLRAQLLSQSRSSRTSCRRE